MARTSSYCSNCGSEVDAGARFCTQCGTPARQSDASPEAREDNRPPRIERGTLPVGAARSGFVRFLRIDSSGGFAGIVSPILIWTAAVGILTWSILGLLSLRFDLSFLNLQDLFFTMLIIVGIILSLAANAFLVVSYRDLTGASGQVMKHLPMVWAAALCVGLSIMIWQVWADFAGGPNELRRAMFSLIGVGVCGTYGGYLSLVAVGPDRIYRAVRWAVYILLAVVAVEILDALWWGTGHLSGAEIGEHFLVAGGTALSVVIVYSIIAFFMAQASGKRLQAGVLVAYLLFGLIGFTVAVGSLWDTFPPGAIRFVHGAIVIVLVSTIGLLMVQHFHRKRDTGSQPTESASAADKPRVADAEV